MTDAELGAELCPDDPAVGLRAVERMTTARKMSYVQLIDTARRLNEWKAGIGEKPGGVIVCGPTRRRIAE